VDVLVVVIVVVRVILAGHEDDHGRSRPIAVVEG